MRAVPSSSWSSFSVPQQTSHWVLWIQFQVQIFSCISLPASALIHPPAQTPAKAFLMEVVRNQFSMISIFMNTPPILPVREFGEHSPTSQRPRPVKFTPCACIGQIRVLNSYWCRDEWFQKGSMHSSGFQSKRQTIFNKDVMIKATAFLHNKVHSQRWARQGLRKKWTQISCGLWTCRLVPVRFLRPSWRRPKLPSLR